MRHIILTISLALSCILTWQLTAANRLVQSQHRLIQEQRQVMTRQQQQLTQAQQAQEAMLKAQRQPVRIAQK